MSPLLPLSMVGPDSPLCIDWSDAKAVDEHEGTIVEMLTVWNLHEKDIRGWMKMRDVAGVSGEIQAMIDFDMRARHSDWVCRVVMARLKFRTCLFDPYENTEIMSFALEKIVGNE
jgi:hypothetical protein